MAYEKVKAYFDSCGLGDRVHWGEESSATVEAAALAVGCEPKQIAKSMTFLVNDEPVMVVMAGDAKTDNKKFKAAFQQKAKMIPWDAVEGYIGHAPGGVCPFVIHENVKVYLDESLRRFEEVYPAAGDGHSFVRLSLPELEAHSKALGWVDVGGGWT